MPVQYDQKNDSTAFAVHTLLISYDTLSVPGLGMQMIAAQPEPQNAGNFRPR
jgi:hypothetical protein